MREQIQNFIQTCGGHASSLAIATQILRLRNVTPAAAERVVQGLLKTESRFVSDGVGNWYLAQTQAASAAEAPTQVCLMFTPMRTAELRQAQRCILGWQILPAGTRHLCEIVLAQATPATSNESDLAACSAAAFVQRFYGEIQMLPLLAWNLAPVLFALRRILANMPEAWLPPSRLALQSLARNLLRLSRPPRLAAVQQQLLGTKLRSESWQDHMQAQQEIWEALQHLAAARGLKSFAQLAHYAQHATHRDFSQYDFNEQELAAAPETPGVYMMKDNADRVIYVGKAANLRERARSYFANAFSDEPKLQKLRARVTQLCFEPCDTELEALLREQACIKRFRPEFNRQVQIHTSSTAPRERFRGIFVVPLRGAAQVSGKPRVVLYFLSAARLQKLAVTLERIPRARLRKAVAKYLSQSPGDIITASSEIARRWFQLNRAWVSALFPEAEEPAEIVTQRLLALLRSPEIMHERVELAGT